MSKVSFRHAFARWYDMMENERARMDNRQKSGEASLSWEALDHICGLAVESGMKALMFKANMVKPDPSGDYPADQDGRRPHVDALWDIFLAKASERTASEWVRTLNGGKGTPVHVFQAWRAEHRYAPDDTVAEKTVQSRLQMAKRLKKIAEEEGL